MAGTCRMSVISPCNRGMKLVLQTQLLPDVPTAARLRETVERFNEAASWLAGVAFERRFTRTSTSTTSPIATCGRGSASPPTWPAAVCPGLDAYKRDKAIRPKFRKHAAVPY